MNHKNPDSWRDAALDAFSRPRDEEGESKLLWRITTETLREHGIEHDRDVYAIRLKPTVYSYTGRRDEVIPGTDALRMRAAKVFWEWIRDAGVDVPVRHYDDDFYVVDAVVAPPVEVVVKAAHVGTPKHRLYGVENFRTRDGTVVAPDHAHPRYVRFDWRNPKFHPVDGRPMADECIPEGLADHWIDVANAKLTASMAFGALSRQLRRRGVELQDICFFIAQDGLTLFGEVSPDCMRAKWASLDLDKDAFRKGNDAASVVAAYRRLVDIVENEPVPSGSPWQRDGSPPRWRELLGTLDVMDRRESMDRYVDQGHFLRDLEATMADEVAMADIASRSVLHTNGFAKVSLAREGGRNVRLHVWPLSDVEQDHEPHDHRWDFVSRVLTGIVGNRVMREGIDGAPYDKYVAAPSSVSATRCYVLEGKRLLAVSHERRHMAGETYRMGSDSPHVAFVPPGGRTATLVLTERAVKPSSVVYMPDGRLPPSGVRLDPLSVETLYRLLEGVKADLGARSFMDDDVYVYGP